MSGSALKFSAVVVAEVPRLAPQRPPDAARRAGVAAVHDFAEQVGEQVDDLGRHAVLGGFGRVLHE